VGSTDYSQDLAGSMTCYAAGIPFFKGTLFGNLFYSAVLFGGFELAQPLLVRICDPCPNSLLIASSSYPAFHPPTTL
jgi:hypothetical protein